MKKLLIVTFVAVTASAQQEPPPRKSIELSGGRAADFPVGPFTDSWESLKDNYKTPQWFIDAKFGIFIHWGVYSVAATGSEWYPRHMYGALLKHHTENWGKNLVIKILFLCLPQKNLILIHGLYFLKKLVPNT
jgi:alpha-L-fucosidase